MKILITGGTGFLGKTVATMLLIAGHDVTIIDNKFTSRDNVKDSYYINGDINDNELVDTAVKNMDFVFHFAGILGTNETLDIIQKTNEVNINGTVNVLSACTKYDVPMLFSSKPNPPGFLNPYSITKQAAESYCMMFHEMYDTHVTVPKIMYLYGPGQLPFPLANYKKYIPTFALAALNNEPIEIYGSGNQMIDPILVTDAAKIMVNLMDDMLLDGYSNGEIYEVGSGIGIKVNDIVDRIIELTDSKSETKHIHMRPGEPNISTVISDVESYPLDPIKLTNFDDGLKNTIKFYKDHYE